MARRQRVSATSTDDSRISRWRVPPSRPRPARAWAGRRARRLPAAADRPPRGFVRRRPAGPVGRPPPFGEADHQEGHADVRPADQHVDHVVLAGVDEGEGHRQGVGQQQRPPPAPGGPQEEQHHEEGPRGVQRRHGGDRVRGDLPGVEQVARAVHAELLPPPRGDPGHLLDEPVLGGPPGRGGRVEEVGGQAGGAEEAPPPHVRAPARPVAQPEHGGGGERDDEVREVDPADEHVPPLHLGPVEVLLQPHGGHLPAGRPPEHEPVGGHQLVRVRGRAVVGEAPREVVRGEEEHHRQPVPAETQVAAPGPGRVPGDGGRPDPDERVHRVGRQPDDEPTGHERDPPDRHRGQAAATAVRRCRRVGPGGGLGSVTTAIAVKVNGGPDIDRRHMAHRASST